MKCEIKIVGSTDDPVAAAQGAVNASGMADAVGTYSYGNRQCNPPIEYESGPEEIEQASVMEIKFASVIAARRADELNLSSSAFEGSSPSGKRGYTVGDVERIADDQ